MPLGAVAKYYDEFVREDISGTTRAIFTILVHVAYGRGSVLFRRRCDTLCTSGFVDDIMVFFYNGPYMGMNFATKDRFRLNLLMFTVKSVIFNRIQFFIVKGHNLDNISKSLAN